MKFPTGQASNPDVMIVNGGTSLTMRMSQEFLSRNFAGGTYLRWVDAYNDIEAQMDCADGRYAGFVLFGDPDAGQPYTSYQNQAKLTQYATLVSGNCFVWTKQYETLGFDARNGLGPETPLVYTAGMALYVSENGKITNENESDQTLFPSHTTYPNGDPMGDNAQLGYCVVPPSDATQSYMLIQQF